MGMESALEREIYKMRVLLPSILLLLPAMESLAAPGEIILVRPTRILKRNGDFRLYAELPCQSISAPERGVQLVSGWDGEGDQAYSVGLLVSTDSRYCEKGPLKEFSFEFSYDALGLDIETGRDEILVPMDLVR